MKDQDEEAYDFWLEGDTESLSKRLRKELPSERLQAQDYRNRQLQAARLQKERERAEREKAEKAKRRAERTRTVTINVTAPSLPIPSEHFENWKTKFSQIPKRLKRVSRKTVLASGGIVVMLLVGIVVFNGITGSDTNTGKQASAEQRGKDGIPFKPLVPKSKADKKITDENGFNYDQTRKVLSYKDSWAEANLTVSQQTLPETITADPKALENIAKTFQAKNPLDTKKGKAYLTESVDAKNDKTTTTYSSQVAVLATDKVLIFIYSDRKMEPAVWQDYINLLQ